METALWIIGIYLVMGIFATWVTWKPEQDGWLWSVLLWPVVLFSEVAP